MNLFIHLQGTKYICFKIIAASKCSVSQDKLNVGARNALNFSTQHMASLEIWLCIKLTNSNEKQKPEENINLQGRFFYLQIRTKE